MNQRLNKVSSLVKQTVAAVLPELAGNESAKITVTAVELSPDLRTGTVWLGLLGDQATQGRLMALISQLRPDIQQRLGETLTTKFVPRLSFRIDQSGDYAQHIQEIIREL
jgi:ribosome-binding factor A